MFNDDFSITKSVKFSEPRKRTCSVNSTAKLKKTKDSNGQKMINQYIIEKELGKGSFATVHLGFDKNTGVKYAIKEMNKVLLMKK